MQLYEQPLDSTIEQAIIMYAYRMNNTHVPHSKVTHIMLVQKYSHIELRMLHLVRRMSLKLTI